MKSNIVAFFLTIGSVGLAVLIMWFYNMSDRTPPEMRFVAMELTYNSSTKEADLLNGVMARDDVDGDLTSRIVVEKTILDEEQETAVVYYAVSDLSGNVTKQSRVFPADINDLKGIVPEEEVLYPENESMFSIGTVEGYGNSLEEAGTEGQTENSGEAASTDGEQEQTTGN
ncbi:MULTISPECIES: hypothetical protein [unclassified Butyrivibrio]|uniref:hypothetical protein n=1 Tax=unclassified Butyrivibrio TaxID=2639466 RepID=UPI0012DF1006|nr:MULTISPECIES: hypothetical protein [unclassified Butyrivibrio]